jgi:hypothetical protein
MNRRTFIRTVALSLTLAPLAAEAQQPRVARIGVITHGSSATSSKTDD